MVLGQQHRKQYDSVSTTRTFFCIFCTDLSSLFWVSSWQHICGRTYLFWWMAKRLNHLSWSSLGRSIVTWLLTNILYKRSSGIEPSHTDRIQTETLDNFCVYQSKRDADNDHTKHATRLHTYQDRIRLA